MTRRDIEARIIPPSVPVELRAGVIQRAIETVTPVCAECRGHACMACMRREMHMACVADCVNGCDWARADDTDYEVRMKVCTEIGCSTLVPTSGRCVVHQRDRERARGSRQARGYDTAHVALRRRWEPLVATGTVQCWRCGELIGSAEAWDLGHDDEDRSVTRGPEHAGRCNRAAAGRASHR